jgi:urease accessory protein UreE
MADVLSPRQAALLAWSIGNLHQPIEILHGCIRVADEPVVRHLFESLRLPYLKVEAVFQPQSPGTKAHHHAHHLEQAHHH